MENRRILKWHTWSAARKGMVIGVAIAALLTIGVESIMMVTQDTDDASARNINYLVACTMGLPINLPTEIVGRFTGLALPEQVTVGAICVITIINSLTFGAFCGIGGYIGHLLAQSFREIRREKN